MHTTDTHCTLVPASPSVVLPAHARAANESLYDRSTQLYCLYILPVLSVLHCTAHRYDIKQVVSAAGPEDRLHVVQRGGDASDSDNTSSRGATPHCDYKLYLIQEFCSGNLEEVCGEGLLHDPATGHPDLPVLVSLLRDVARGLE